MFVQVGNNTFQLSLKDRDFFFKVEKNNGGSHLPPSPPAHSDPFSTLLCSALCPKRLPPGDCLTPLLCPLPSSWVWSIEVSGG